MTRGGTAISGDEFQVKTPGASSEALEGSVPSGPLLIHGRHSGPPAIMLKQASELFDFLSRSISAAKSCVCWESNSSPYSLQCRKTPNETTNEP